MYMQNFLIPLLILGLSGCKQMPDVPTAIAPYRIDVQQGNVVTQDMVDKLKPGMTRAQVRFVLGSPLIVDPFHTDRWDYIYTYQKQGKETERRIITVIFDDDKLLRLEGDVTALPSAAKPSALPAEKPAAKPAAAVTTTPRPPERSGAAQAPVQNEAVKAQGVSPAATVAPVDGAKPEAGKSGSPSGAKPDAAKDKPMEEKGFFGKILDKIGF